MSDSDVKAIALFFFFTMLDEKRATLASAQAYELCFKMREKDESSPIGELIVKSTFKVWQMHKSRFIRGRPQYSLNSGWILPDGIDIGVWKDFQKNSTEEDLLALVWAKIIQISESEIAQGLGLSFGTIRYRVSHAIRKLGDFQLGSSAVETQ